MRFEFTAELWRWSARTELWTFIALPEEASAEVAEFAETMPRAGFGAVRVDVRIGSSRWRTSIFPMDDGRYSLPVKAAVRRREGIDLGDEVRVAVELVDV